MTSVQGFSGNGKLSLARRRKRLIASLLLAGALLTASAAHAQAPAVSTPPTEQSLQLAREIIAVIVPADRQQEIYGGIFRAVADQMRAPALARVRSPELRSMLSARFDQLPRKLMPVLDRHLAAMLEASARAYAREFSVEELRQIGVFSRSPAGQHYLSRSTSLLADPDVAAANQAYMADVMVEAETERRELTKVASDYLAKHPEALEDVKP